MKQISNLLETLLERGINPRISNASHRKALEEIADNLLKSKPVAKIGTDYSVLDPTTDYFSRVKAHNKRMGKEAARDIAEYRAKSAPRTRIFTRDELENKYKPWHQAHQTRGKSEELKRIMDDIEATGEITRELPPFSDVKSINDPLYKYINDLVATHEGDGNALRKIQQNKTAKMLQARELYKQMYANKGMSGIKQFQKLAKRY